MRKRGSKTGGPPRPIFSNLDRIFLTRARDSVPADGVLNRGFEILNFCFVIQKISCSGELARFRKNDRL